MRRTWLVVPLIVLCAWATRERVAAPMSPMIERVELAPELQPPRLEVENDVEYADTDWSLDEHAWRVQDKYSSLVESLRQPRRLEELTALLAEYEHHANDYEAIDRDRQLARLTNAIRAVLHPSDFATFELLREADASLREIDDFAGGVSEVAPLTFEQRRALSQAKLASARQAEWATDAIDSSPQSRALLLDAERRSRSEFLQSAHSILSAEQLDHLRAFERTEYERTAATLALRDANNF
jgi:hypothetical protein